VGSKAEEGTILTVITDIAKAVSELSPNTKTEDVFKVMLEAALVSVKNTPELLPVLKEHGVVDAGGFGLATIIQGLLDGWTGQTTSLPAISPVAYVPKVEIEQINDWEGGNYTYCTEFLLHSDDIDPSDALAFLGTMGDSELFIGGCPLFKVHVHTDEPGTVLTYMTGCGQVSEVYIHNMRLQSAVRASMVLEAGQAIVPIGVVVVTPTLEIGKLFEEELPGMCVKSVVSQDGKPSTQDILGAIQTIRAEEVLVLPNDKDVIMAAQAACDLSELKPARVYPTEFVPQGLHVLLEALNAQPTLDSYIETADQAVGGVVSGAVAIASRDSKTVAGHSFSRGQYIGLIGKDVAVSGANRQKLIRRLLKGMMEKLEKSPSLVTFVVGKDFAVKHEDQLSKLAASLDLEATIIRGNQPAYQLLIGVE
jgi:dihydroxyacetone kinase-like predicted kinase